ncbi:MAG: ATP synthase F1 subunit epsilon [Hungatella sp.]|jgi:F-type H+-transporting ATPase subunit epsilon|nr:ATP synthase F1 subunit epsilon [Hungatella sp.]
MADVFKLQIVTPERVFYEGDAGMVELSTTEGDIGVYANHIPMTAIVAPGVLKIHEGSEIKKAALHAGFIEVLPEEITIMAEVVEWPDEIDVKRAEEARIRAERRLKEHSAESDVLRAKLALRRAMTRLSARQ